MIIHRSLPSLTPLPSLSYTHTSVTSRSSSRRRNRVERALGALCIHLSPPRIHYFPKREREGKKKHELSKASYFHVGRGTTTRVVKNFIIAGKELKGINKNDISFGAYRSCTLTNLMHLSRKSRGIAPVCIISTLCSAQPIRRGELFSTTFFRAAGLG